ncbi:hypothetical protein D3C72_1104600 [compost metagenome]
MADKNPRGVRQGQQLLDRAVQGSRVAARKVAARCAVVGHEQGVADEDGVTDPVADAGGGMARRVQDLDLQVPQKETVAVSEGLVKDAGVR